MPRTLTLGALQSSYGDDMGANIARTVDLVRQAAAKGAQVICPSELFQGPYFCVAQEEGWFASAFPWREHPAVLAMSVLAAELGVAIPTSIFEREGPHYFNSLVMIDADGRALGVYRKSHIPDGPGYQEKYYFRPGDTGFRVWDTRFGRIGVGICWDQWYPEAARAMTLMGAEALIYPTAIGSEPHDASLDTATPWRRAMQGHAVSNIIPVVGANRTGFEPWPGPTIPAAASASMAPVSSPITAATWSPNWARTRRAFRSPSSTWTSCACIAPPGASSATGARNCTRRWFRRAHRPERALRAAA